MPLGASDGGRHFVFALSVVTNTDSRFFSICPGRYMAFSSVWIAVASIIAVFDITKAVDENGNVIEPSHEYSSSLVWYVKLLSIVQALNLFHLVFPFSMPLPFECSIKPRSKDAEDLIRSSEVTEY
jgi:hypothetical protein